MVQTKKGAKKARETMIKKMGKEGYIEFHRRIGAIGGQNGHTGGFAANAALASTAGSKGGSRSKAGLKFLKEKGGYYYYVDKEGKKVKIKAGESKNSLGKK